MLGSWLHIEATQAQDNPFFRHPITHLYQGLSSVQSLNRFDQVADDGDLIRAVRDNKNVHFVEASQVTVVRLLPDDTQGNLHQKWFIRLSNGARVYCVYNIDFAEKVPLDLYDVVNVGGHFVAAEKGPLLHWLHEDPKRRRPDGFVELHGQRYGRKRR